MVLWSIYDYILILVIELGFIKFLVGGSNIKLIFKVGEGKNGNLDSFSVGARGIYKGYGDIVEDV